MKGYDITVDLPNLPKGAEVQVNGLGILLNGETTFVSEDAANHWREMNVDLQQEYNDKGQLVTTVNKSGTLLQTLGKVDGLTVSTAEADDPAVEPQTSANIQEQLPLDQQDDDNTEDNDGGDN
jgi:hypothetical protein